MSAKGRRSVGAVVGLLALVAMTGCAAQPTAPALPTSEADATRALQMCLQDAGWDATLDQGGVVVEYPNEQRDAIQRDTDACNEKLDPAAFVTDEQKRMFYDLQVATAECLTEHGAPVTPPSWQTFRDDGSQWSPFVALRDSGHPLEEFDVLISACPQHTYWDVIGR